MRAGVHMTQDIVRTALEAAQKEICSRPLATGDGHEHDLWLRNMLRSAIESLDKPAPVKLIDSIQSAGLRGAAAMAVRDHASMLKPTLGRTDTNFHGEALVTDLASQESDAAATGWNEAIKAVTGIIEPWTDVGTMKLRAGEMTAQEVRTVRAIVGSILRVVGGLKKKTQFEAGSK